MFSLSCPVSDCLFPLLHNSFPADRAQADGSLTQIKDATSRKRSHPISVHVLFDCGCEILVREPTHPGRRLLFLWGYFFIWIQSLACPVTGAVSTTCTVRAVL